MLTMERVLEPELMDDWAQAEAYAKSDFSVVNNAFVERFIKLFPDFQNGLVLDLGCGPADLTIRFAKAIPYAQMFGIDGSDPMLEFGQNAVVASGLSERIRLLKRHLPEHNLPKQGYHAAISNSLLHHLKNPNDLWQPMSELVRPGAPIFVVDLTRPISSGHARRLIEIHSLPTDPDLMKEDFYNSLCAAFRPEEVRIQLNEVGFPQLHVEVVSDRHMMIYGRA